MCLLNRITITSNNRNEGFGLLNTLITLVVLLILLPVLFFSTRTFVTHYTNTNKETKLYAEYYSLYKDLFAITNAIVMPYWFESIPARVTEQSLIFEYIEGIGTNSATVEWDEHTISITSSTGTVHYAIPNNNMKVSLVDDASSNISVLFSITIDKVPQSFELELLP